MYIIYTYNFILFLVHKRFQNRVPKINIDDTKTEIKEEIMDVTENMDSMILNPNTENKMT